LAPTAPLGRFDEEARGETEPNEKGPGTT
jgi:hypothetical protein